MYFLELLLFDLTGQRQCRYIIHLLKSVKPMREMQLKILRILNNVFVFGARCLACFSLGQWYIRMTRKIKETTLYHARVPQIALLISHSPRRLSLSFSTPLHIPRFYSQNSCIAHKSATGSV